MSKNKFIEICEDIKKGYIESSIIEKLQAVNFNVALREQIEECNYSNEYIEDVIKKIAKSSNVSILLLSSLLYMKVRNFEKAFDYAFAAYSKGSNSSDIKMVYINASFEQISDYLRNSNYEKAEKLVSEIRFRFKNTDSEIMNHFFLLEKIIPAYKSIDTKVLEAKKSIEIQQWKIIEIIGLFSAVLAFIITNIQIVTKSLDTNEVFTLMSAMACVLIIFAISISYLFSIVLNDKSSKDKFLSFPSDKRFIALSLSLLVLLFLSFYKINQ